MIPFYDPELKWLWDDKRKEWYLWGLYQGSPVTADWLLQNPKPRPK